MRQPQRNPSPDKVFNDNASTAFFHGTDSIPLCLVCMHLDLPNLYSAGSLTPRSYLTLKHFEALHSLPRS